MNKFLLFLMALGLSPLTSMGQIAVGTSNPEPSAAFEVYSTTKGFLPPRMTEFQMLAIPSPVGGLLIYCTNCIDKGVYIYHDLEFLNAVTGRSGHAYIVNTFVEASSNPAADGTPSLTDLTIYGITNTTGSQAEYEEAIADASPTPTTLEELQAVIDEVNTGIQILNITANATNPASNGLPSLDQLTNIGITGMTESQTYYEEAIADASPTPTTLEELQNIIQIANITLPPVIKSGSTANDLVENTGAEQEIYTIIAYDLIGIDSYSIGGTDSSSFTINLNSGVVTLIENPDFETQAIYSFYVIASDGAGNSSAPKNVTLAINDLDDEAPIITSLASVNSGAEQEIYTVTATDNVGVTSYAIGGTDASAFTINENTGVVTLVANPSYDQQTYTFEVTASDILNNTSIPLTVSLTIDNLVLWGQTRYIMFRGTDANGQYNNIGELDLLDTNGNNLIDNGTLNKNNFEYSYGGGFWSSSSAVDLFDNDPSDAYASNLTSATANTAEKWVLIDLNQTVEIGSLTIQPRSNSDSHIARINHMTVYASDRNDTGFEYTGTPSGNGDEDLLLGTTKEQMKADATLKWKDLTEFTTTNTTINYENANQQLDLTIPIVTSATLTFNIINNSGAGQQVYTATATDNVGVTNFAIGGNDASAFTIDAILGVVTLVDNPILATKASYSFEVTANDAQGNTSAPISVSFSIIDENDLNPVITSGNSTNAIIEDSGPGQEVYTLTTTHYQDVTSYVIGGTDASSFSIDQNTGVVTFLVNPDFETKYSYNFNVTASDADGNSSTTTTIVLNIIDLDDEAPIITSSLVANSIDENSGAGQIVYTATATDNIGVTSYAIGEISATLKEYDQWGNTHRVTTVSIDGTDNNTFSVDENGEVTYHLNPNYELYNSYSFEINASDAQGNTSSWATIELNINDKNDNTQVEWGQVRYILLKGEALWSYFNNIGEVDILDTNGVNLIDNGTLNVNDFTYDYANGYYSGQGGENLFDESASSAYANSQSNIAIDREKWVLIDLNMSVELGALTIQARSNSSSHIDRITHMTVFASDNADDFTFTTDYSGEVLMDQSTSQMKGNEAIRWRDLDEFTTTNISITYENARQQIETD